MSRSCRNHHHQASTMIRNGPCHSNVFHGIRDQTGKSSRSANNPFFKHLHQSSESSECLTPSNIYIRWGKSSRQLEPARAGAAKPWPSEWLSYFNHLSSVHSSELVRFISESIVLCNSTWMLPERGSQCARCLHQQQGLFTRLKALNIVNHES